jgi:hypothetical protein
VLRPASQVALDTDGRICADCIDSSDPHQLIEGEYAVKLGLIEESYRCKSMYCAYDYCPWAAANKEKKCGEKSARKQAARAKCQLFCMHPLCRRAFHAVCFSIVHRVVSRESLGL